MDEYVKLMMGYHPNIILKYSRVSNRISFSNKDLILKSIVDMNMYVEMSVKPITNTKYYIRFDINSNIIIKIRFQRDNMNLSIIDLVKMYIIVDIDINDEYITNTELYNELFSTKIHLSNEGYNININYEDIIKLYQILKQCYYSLIFSDKNIFILDVKYSSIDNLYMDECFNNALKTISKVYNNNLITNNL